MGLKSIFNKLLTHKQNLHQSHRWRRSLELIPNARKTSNIVKTLQKASIFTNYNLMQNIHLSFWIMMENRSIGWIWVYVHLSTSQYPENASLKIKNTKLCLEGMKLQNNTKGKTMIFLLINPGLFLTEIHETLMDVNAIKNVQKDYKVV